MPNEPLELFYVYSHKDEAFRKQLETHLSVLNRQGSIQQWSDREIRPGSVWGDAIDAHLRSARIILLLVSSDFLSSDYGYGIEMQEALRKQREGEARVIPIILRDCEWEKTPLGALQA